MKITCAASVALLASQVTAFDIIRASSLNCREKPTTKSDVVKIYSLGDDVDIVCQIEGQKQMGSKVWDKTQDGCYVLDYYLYTGFSYMFKPLCTDSSESASSSSSSNTEHNSSSKSSDNEEGGPKSTDSSDDASESIDDSSEPSASEKSSDDIDNDDDNSELGPNDSDLEESNSDNTESDDTETTSSASALTKGSLLLAIASIAAMF
ncbi:hypothetical protein IWW36_001791 [Coemansia brasiliensis]|uniref:Uncharacterized protein n=1 Tax=Coemansia brasiliensis TaxID=2650707 RepID=A0A9W8M1Q4_9FUNG|nr:hypothetical protein IWW36_001791 [Coemansia brasiliensis]